MTNKLLILTLLVVANISQGYSQVTIGNIEKPIEGALLQLKNIDGVTDGSANSIKGLGLPRVNLKNIKLLDPLMENPTEDEKKILTGALVYQPQIGSNPRCDVMYPGMFVWNGYSWLNLNHPIEVSSSVNIFTDSRDPNDVQKYYTRDFGDAGVWFLENIRAKKFDPIRDNPVETIADELSGPTMADSKTIPQWCYPQVLGSTLNTPDFYLSHEKYGLLYNWVGANKSASLYIEQGAVKDGVNGQEARQGICPSGWHLPSDLEWTILESEIMKNTKKYGYDNVNYVDLPGGTLPLDNSQLDIFRGNVGLIFKSECASPYDAPGGNKNIMGKSPLPSEGGLSIEYAGASKNNMANYENTSAYLWSSSLSNIHSGGSNVFAYRRYLNDSQTQINRDYLDVSWYFSARCVKNGTVNQNETLTSSNGVANNGWLSVDGIKLVNEKQQNIVLRGVSFGQHQWWPRFYNSETVTWLKKDFNCNLIRIPIGDQYAEDSYSNNPAQAMKCARAAIDAAIENDMYAIINWHVHIFEEHVAHKFFAEIAKDYKDCPNLLYEIYSEPIDYEWDELKKLSENTIKYLREDLGVNNVILVGVPNYTTDVDIAAEDPIVDYKDLMYSVHFYAETHQDLLRGKVQTALNKGLPIFVCESGGMDAAGEGAINYVSWSKWKTLMDDNNLSWVAFAVADKNIACCMIKDENSPISNWADSDLKEWGIFVRKILRSYTPNF